MGFHLREAFAKAVEILVIVLAEPGRTLRFASVLLVLYLALTPFALPAPGTGVPGGLALVLAHTLLMLWVSVAVALRWHRMILFGEDGVRWLDLPLGNRELRYFGRSVMVAVVIALAVGAALGLVAGLISAVRAGGDAASGLVLSGLMAFGLLLGYYLLARLGLALPASAGDGDGRLATAWALSRAHWRPFCALLILVSLPQLLATLLIELLLVAGPVLLWPLLLLARELVFLYGVALLAAALSSNYRVVAAPGGPPPAPVD